MTEISYNELYRIINKSLAGVGKCSDETVNDEISSWVFEYRKWLSSGTQLSLFDENCPLKEDVRRAVSFCDDLEEYRKFSDPYLDDTPELNKEFWQRLFEHTKYYRPYIKPENLLLLNAIEDNAKRYLPEFRANLLIEDYNKKMLRIFHEKKEQQKLKRKKEPHHVGYERIAAILFEDIWQDRELKDIAPCPEKIRLLQNYLVLVDCLPKEKYGRVKKFRLKYNINAEIKTNASVLGMDELAKYAHEEMKRFESAEEHTLLRSKNERIQREIHDKRIHDEWYYK